MNKTHTLKLFVSTLLLVSSVVVGSIFLTPLTASAQFLEGGRSEQIKFCSCSFCFKLEVGSPKDGTFMWCPLWTRTYQYYNVFPNAWQLGKSYMWIPCLQISYPKCKTDGGGYMLDMTGTSQGT